MSNPAGAAPRAALENSDAFEGGVPAWALTSGRSADEEGDEDSDGYVEVEIE